jgi:hypothetical protein
VPARGWPSGRWRWAGLLRCAAAPQLLVRHVQRGCCASLVLLGSRSSVVAPWRLATVPIGLEEYQAKAAVQFTGSFLICPHSSSSGIRCRRSGGPRPWTPLGPLLCRPWPVVQAATCSGRLLTSFGWGLGRSPCSCVSLWGLFSFSALAARRLVVSLGAGSILWRTS